MGLFKKEPTFQEDKDSEERTVDDIVAELDVQLVKARVLLRELQQAARMAETRERGG